jgi:Uma2 family endonuclease
VSPPVRTRSVDTRVALTDYLARLGPVRPFGLVFGIPQQALRVPCPAHTAIVRRLTQGLHTQLQRDHEGARLYSPADVILDAAQSLVVHPAVAVVLPDRLDTCLDHIWGPPNLVVDVLWPATARRARHSKLLWYRTYGVQECWFVDARHNRVEVYTFKGWNCVPYLYTGQTRINSKTLPHCDMTATDIFNAIPSSLEEHAHTDRMYRHATFA